MQQELHVSCRLPRAEHLRCEQKLRLALRGDGRLGRVLRGDITRARRFVVMDGWSDRRGRDGAESPARVIGRHGNEVTTE